MTNKTLTLSVLSVVALLVLMSFASALSVTSVSPSTLSQSSSSFDVSLSGTAGELVSFSISPTADFTKDNSITYTLSNLTLNASGVGTTTISYTVPSDFEFLDYAPVLTATGNSSGSTTKTLSFSKTTFCSFDGNDAENISEKDLKVEIDDIKVVSGFGDDEDWYAFDQIEVDVIVSNENDDYDINDISLEWGLLDKKTGDWVIEMDEEDNFDLKDGDEKTVTFSFALDDDLDVNLEDLDNSELVLYVRATGDVDDEDGEYSTCDYDQTASKDLTFNLEDDFAVVANINMPQTISCGSDLEISGDVWNIGSDDQDAVSMSVYNKELGIDQTIEVGDIDSFESESFSITTTIPTDAQEKAYTLSFYTLDEDGDVYESGDDEESKVTQTIIVSGACSYAPKASISAELTSEARAGSELVVKALVTNTDSKKASFTLTLNNYDSWASSANIEPVSFDLEAGESKEVTITLNVNENVSEEQTFNMVLKQGSKTLSQPVGVTIEAKQSEFLAGVKEFVKGSLGKSWYLWLIAAVNVALLVGVIVLAAKAFKKKK